MEKEYAHQVRISMRAMAYTRAMGELESMGWTFMSHDSDVEKNAIFQKLLNQFKKDIEDNELHC